MTGIATLFKGVRIIPVATLDDPAQAVCIAQKLAADGMPAVEVTFRTPRALDCIRAIASALPNVIVGAGTVLAPQQMDDARKAGARFLVSPGSTRELVAAARAGQQPWLPGVATPSEAMRMRNAGFDHLKFFPAGPSGGVAFLKAIAPVLQDVKFCPTGGVDQSNAESYLALPRSTHLRASRRIEARMFPPASRPHPSRRASTKRSSDLQSSQLSTRSCPALCRASTFLRNSPRGKTLVAGTSPAMTENGSI